MQRHEKRRANTFLASHASLFKASVISELNYSRERFICIDKWQLMEGMIKSERSYRLGNVSGWYAKEFLHHIFFSRSCSSILFPPFVRLRSSHVPSSCLLHPPPLEVTDVISYDLQPNAINPTGIWESSYAVPWTSLVSIQNRRSSRQTVLHPAPQG